MMAILSKVFRFVPGCGAQARPALVLRRTADFPLPLMTFDTDDDGNERLLRNT
jgi:hypothetical protein